MSPRLGRLLVLALLFGLPAGAHAGWHALGGDTGRSAVAFDAAGNVIVAGGGKIDADQHYDAAVGKRAAADGSLLWSFHILGVEGGASFDDVVVDAAGDVIVSGGQSQGSNTRPPTLLVLKLDGDTGAEVWRFALPSTISNRNSSGHDLALLADGGVAVAGITYSPDAQHFTAIRLDADGNQVWIRELTGSVFGGINIAWAVDVDAAGDVFAGGYTENALTNLDFTVAKLDGATGTQLWRYVTGGTDWSYDSAGEVRVLPSGDVIGSGFIDNASTGLDGIVVRIAGIDGSEVWRQEYDSPGHFNDYAAAALGPAGEVALAVGYGTEAGEHFASPDEHEIIRVSSATGGILWQRTVTGTGVGSSHFGGLAVGAGGDVVFGAGLVNQITGTDYTLVELSGADGSELWKHVLSGTNAAADDAAGRPVLAPNGDIAVAGHLGTQVLSSLYDGDGSPLPPPVIIPDELVATSKLLIVDGGTATKRKLSLVVKDPAVSAEAPLSQNHPERVGAELLVRNPVTAEELRIVLPASGWSTKGGHRFRGDASSCRVATIKYGLLKITCKGSAMAFTLDEAAQGALEVRFKLGSLPAPPQSYCARITTPVVDVAGRYIGKGAPAPGACPAVP